MLKVIKCPKCSKNMMISKKEGDVVCLACDYKLSSIEIREILQKTYGKESYESVIWFNDVHDHVMGPSSKFDDIDDFIKAVIKENETIIEEKIELGPVKEAIYILTTKGLSPESSYMFSETDIEIIPCYYANVITIENEA